MPCLLFSDSMRRLCLVLPASSPARVMGHCVGALLIFAAEASEVEPYTEPMQNFIGTRADGSYFYSLRADERAIINLTLGDGAVVFNGDAEVTACWMRLTPPKQVSISDGPEGTAAGGSEHSSARRLTSCCSNRMFAVCVSEIGGKLSVFQGGITKLKTGALYRQAHLDPQQIVALAVDEVLKKTGGSTIGRGSSVRAGQLAASTEIGHSSAAPTALKFKLTLERQARLEDIDRVSEISENACKRGLLRKEVKAWLSDRNLQLAREPGTLEAAEKWLWERHLCVPDLTNERTLSSLTSSLEINDFLKDRLRTHGSDVALGFSMFDFTAVRETEFEIIISIDGRLAPASTADEARVCKAIENDIQRQCGFSVRFERFGSIVVFGPRLVFLWFQEQLAKGITVEIIGYRVTHVACGHEIVVSFSAMPSQIVLTMLSSVDELAKDERTVRQLVHDLQRQNDARNTMSDTALSRRTQVDHLHEHSDIMEAKQPLVQGAAPIEDVKTSPGSASQGECSSRDCAVATSHFYSW